jgi:hypothetical protein
MFISSRWTVDDDDDDAEDEDVESRWNAQCKRGDIVNSIVNPYNNENAGEDVHRARRSVREDSVALSVVALLGGWDDSTDVVIVVASDLSISIIIPPSSSSSMPSFSGTASYPPRLIQWGRREAIIAFAVMIIWGGDVCGRPAGAYRW